MYYMKTKLKIFIYTNILIFYFISKICVEKIKKLKYK